MQLETTEKIKGTGSGRKFSRWYSLYLHHGFLAQAFAPEVEGGFFLCQTKTPQFTNAIRSFALKDVNMWCYL